MVSELEGSSSSSMTDMRRSLAVVSCRGGALITFYSIERVLELYMLQRASRHGSHGSRDRTAGGSPSRTESGAKEG